MSTENDLPSPKGQHDSFRVFCLKSALFLGPSAISIAWITGAIEFGVPAPLIILNYWAWLILCGAGFIAGLNSYLKNKFDPQNLTLDWFSAGCVMAGVISFVYGRFAIALS